MREMRWSQADLAAACGATRQTVSRWLQDGEIKIDPAFAFRLQDASGFCARWILLGEGPVHVADNDLPLMPEELRAEIHRHAHALVAIYRQHNKS
jgi:transcriptional regulator with XRE-family HTH domain